VSPAYPFLSCALPGLTGEALWVQSSAHPRPPALEALPTSFAQRQLDAWLFDPAYRKSLVDLFSALPAISPFDLSAIHPDHLEAHIGPRLRRALDLGEIVILAPRPNPLPAAPGRAPTLPKAPPKAPEPKAPREETTWFSIRVLDEIGAPIDGIELYITEAGARRTLETNSDGVARLDGARTSFAHVEIGSIEALREKLAPRWQKPREPRIPKGPHTFVRELDAFLESVSIESETPATLVLKPTFRCHEIAGAHFAFGRSFVRANAIATLAAIAEDLHGEPIRRAMILAHTDLTGKEALNKELSERRARALYALFTHDAAAWEELFMGKWSGGNWSERWGTREVQHMLRALHVTADDGLPPDETGTQDQRSTEALKRFQRGDYPDKPAEQAPLAPDGVVGPLPRNELFLAYAKRISREPVPADRIAKVNGELFMGCGEYNPFTLSAKDEESRRAVVFLFDAAAEPKALPCKLRSLGPCRANIDPPQSEPDPEGKPPYRCRVYQEVAKRCPCNGGADLSHDLILQFPLTLADADSMPHVFIVESEDGTIVKERALAAHARAHDEGFVELFFADLPPAHAYRLRCEGAEAPYVVFDYTPYEELGAQAIDPDHLLPVPLPAS